MARPKQWLPPRAWERRYGRFLRRKVDDARLEFLARLEAIRRAQRALQYTPEPETPEDEQELEADSESIAILIAGFLAWWNLQLPTIRAEISGYYHGVNVFNDTQFRAVVRSITGVTLPPTRTAPVQNELVSSTAEILNRLGDVDVFRQEEYLPGTRDNWLDDQTSKLTGEIQKSVAVSEASLRNAIVTGAAATTILEAINRTFNVSGKKVINVAADSIDSLNSQLQQKRAQSVGSEEYEWNTQRDSHVRGDPSGVYPKARPSHFARDRKIFRWSNPPEGGHPGQAYLCRCYAVIRLRRK